MLSNHRKPQNKKRKARSDRAVRPLATPLGSALKALPFSPSYRRTFTFPADCAPDDHRRSGPLPHGCRAYLRLFHGFLGRCVCDPVSRAPSSASLRAFCRRVTGTALFFGRPVFTRKSPAHSLSGTAGRTVRTDFPGRPAGFAFRRAGKAPQTPPLIR